jgi:hypothetical protein
MLQLKIYEKPAYSRDLLRMCTLKVILIKGIDTACVALRPAKTSPVLVEVRYCGQYVMAGRNAAKATETSQSSWGSPREADR